MRQLQKRIISAVASSNDNNVKEVLVALSLIGLSRDATLVRIAIVGDKSKVIQKGEEILFEYF